MFHELLLANFEVHKTARFVQVVEVDAMWPILARRNKWNGAIIIGRGALLRHIRSIWWRGSVWSRILYKK